jgi:hypothetical protein
MILSQGRFNLIRKMPFQAVDFTQSALSVYTHGQFGVSHLHCDRGCAVNVMLYGKESFWVCVDSRRLSHEEISKIIQFEHNLLTIQSPKSKGNSWDSLMIDLVEGIRFLVDDPGAVYCVKQLPGQRVDIPSGVIHAVYTEGSLGTASGGKGEFGALKFAFDYPPLEEFTEYFADRDKHFHAAKQVQGSRLHGWSDPAGDCVKIDTWLLSAFLNQE